MDATQIIIVGVLLFTCSLLQSAVGFGRALFVIPVLLWIGMPLQNAIAVSVASGVAQMAISAFHLRRDVDGRSLLPFIISAVLAMPIGVLALSVLITLEKDTVGQFVGAIILAIMASQWLCKVRPRDHLHQAWGYAAFMSCGMLYGLAGVGGPLIAMWAMAHNWSGRRMRGTILASFTVITPFLAGLLYMKFGQPILWPLLTGVMFLPVVILGSIAGLWIGNRIPRKRLVQIGWTLLLLLSIRMILGPMF